MAEKGGEGEIPFHTVVVEFRIYSLDSASTDLDGHHLETRTTRDRVVSVSHKDTQPGVDSFHAHGHLLVEP